MIELNAEIFHEEVLHANGLIVVLFWGDQCAKCKTVMPQLEEFALINNNTAKFCILNAMANKQLSISQRVVSVPTIVIYRNGDKEAQFANTFSMQDIQIKLQELVKNQEEELLI
jgi:thioredoxin 1